MEKQKSILYLECNSGISGDMTVAALLDLGADREVLKKALKSVPVHGFRIRISRVKKAGLDVCDFHVILDEEHENHDHDMEYLFGGAGSHAEIHGEGYDHVEEQEHPHRHDHGEEHGHPQEHDHGGHPHEHRGLPEILRIIERTDMTEGAKEIAVRIFGILAKAEAGAHGVLEDEVHFHEVGAVDSIVDIISAAVCLDNLGVEQCIIPGLCEGTGTIRCQHGIMSVPVPAVLNIVQEHGLKLSVTDVKGELVTPTGAAIAAAVRTGEVLPKSFRVIKSGMGGGKRAYERPSILRAMLIEETEKSVSDRENAGRGKGTTAGENGETDMVNVDDGNVIRTAKNDDRDVIYKLETNIDDCSSEILGYVMERLFRAGARDVHYIPVYMKKNRPAYQLNVICREEQIPEMEQIIFTGTTTIGIRRQRMERSVLWRRSIEIRTEWGDAQVKECRLPGGRDVRYYPEYDSVIKLSENSGKSYQDMYHLIVEQCKERKAGGVKKPESGGRRFLWTGNWRKNTGH